MRISPINFFIVSCVSFWTLTAENIYESIARINSTTLTQKQEQKSDSLNDLMSRAKQFHEIVYDNLNRQLNPSPQAKRQTIFSLLSTYEKQHPLSTSTCMDQTTWCDLELLCGSKEAPTIYLANKLDRTSTGMGQAVFYRKLVQPLTNYQELVEQQEVIKELVHNQKLFDELDTAFKDLAAHENALISFWSDTFFASMFGKEGYQPPFVNSITWIKKLAQWCDKQELVVEVNDKLSDVQLFTWIGASAAGAITLPLAGIAKIAHYPVPSPLSWINNKLGLGAMSLFTISGTLLYLLSFTPNKRYQGYSDVATGAISSLSIYNSIRDYKSSRAIGNSIETKLTHVAQYFTTINQLMNSLKKNNSIIQRMPALQEYDTVITKLAQSKDIAHLLSLLQTSTFQKNKNYLCPLCWGRVYVAYRLLTSVKDELVPLMLTIGELDSYLSVARLYKEFQNKPVTFCFPTYCLASTAPAIQLKDFWHPALNPASVITNSITIGQDQAPNIIITGPNAGGKSTTAKALTLAIILAQSLGIAPARELTFTPYAHVITYLNITDDITVGNSHFMAEAQRARDLINTAQNAEKTHTWSLTISDEIFNGTTYKEGQAAAYCLIDTLGTYKNNTSITCTHFPQLTQLDKKRDFANYKVSIGYNNQGVITYPYKLEPGITNQIVTFDILKEKGFADEFLTKAKNLLLRTLSTEAVLGCLPQLSIEPNHAAA